MRACGVVLMLVVLAGCSDQDQSGPERVRAATRAYVESKPVKTVAAYADAVGQGLFDPMVDNMKRRQVLYEASRRGMAPTRPLDDGEMCLGDSIVRKDVVKGVPTYTQVLHGGRPIYCKGWR